MSQSTISGHIISENGAGLEYANVLVLHATDSSLVKGDLSYEQGKYNFDLSDGKYLISTNMVGYSTAFSKVFNVNGQDIKVEDILLTEGIAMNEVTVIGQKPLIELKADKMIVNVENSIVSAGNSALDILKKSPGVVVDNNDRISLRGREGVLVTINGKQQYMSNDDIARMLENMSASNIKSIEIITNPSAKYDAEGNVGIINIVLKKNEKIGYNGQAGITGRTGFAQSYFTDLNLNYRTEKVNVYGGGDYYDWGWVQKIYLDRRIPSSEGYTTFDQFSDMNRGGKGYNVKLGVDWDLTDKTTIGILAKTNDGNEFSLNDNNTIIIGDNGPDYYRLFVDTDGDEEYNQNSANFNVSHKFNDKGMTLDFDTDYSVYSNDALMDYLNYYYTIDNDAVRSPYLLRNLTYRKIDIIASKLDFKLPITEKSTVEVGAKYSTVSTMNDTKFEQLEADSSWTNLDNRSNTFRYQEDVLAGYVNGATQIGPLMIQGGLRVEHTNSEGYSMTLDQLVPRRYTDFFPSLSVSHQVGSQHSLSYSYSRRLNRPNYKSLNPFEFFLDEYTFERGNPFLNPQYSNNFGVNYSLANSLFVSLNYSLTTDALSEVIEQNSEENKTFQTEINFDEVQNYSISISAPKVWSEWFTSRINYTSFYNQFSSTFSNGDIDNGGLAHVIYLSNEFNIGNDWNAELSGNYQSRMIFGIYEIAPRHSVDIGVSKKVMDGKGVLKFNITDIFVGQRSNITINQGDIDLDINQRNDNRRASLTFNYSFGNQKVKQARRRKTATEEEKNRI